MQISVYVSWKPPNTQMYENDSWVIFYNLFINIMGTI